METRSLRLIENWQISGKVIIFVTSSNVGSVVEFSPATREARVRFPDVANVFKFQLFKADELIEAMLVQCNAIEKLNKQIRDIKGQINMYRAETQRLVPDI